MGESPSPNPRPRSWQEQPSVGAARGAPAPRRRRKVVFLLAAILALAGVLAAVPFFFHRFEPPFFVTISVSEYDQGGLPPNPLAEQDSDALLPFFAEDRRVRAVGARQRDRLLDELQRLEGRREGAVVVHLSAHAVARDGKVFLLPADARLEDRLKWLDLDDVLERLRRCPAPHKLLVLDLAHPIADARLGILGDDVAGRLQARLEGLDDAGLLVLCSCARGQVSLPGEALGTTAFGHYLAEGLSGACDGAGPGGQRDELLTVRELYEFVRPRVDRWAREDRGARQTPLLFGTGADFPLVQGYAAAPEAAGLADGPAALAEGWKLRDGWWDDGSFRLAPAAFRRAEVALLLAERRWRAGVEPGRVADDLGRELQACTDRLDRARKAARADSDFTPRSLAQARGPAARTDAALREALRTLLALPDQVPPPKPEELAMARKGFLDKYAKAPFADVAAAAFDELAEADTTGPEKFVAVRDLLDALPLRRAFTETILVERLAAWPEVKKWPAEGASRLLRAVREQEKALAADPEVLGWLARDLDEAIRLRREAEDRLFREKAASWGEIVTALEGVEERFRRAARHADALRQALQLRDEAFALLPGFEAYLARRAPDPRTDRAWEGAVQAAVELSALLNRPADGTPAGVEDPGQTAGALRGQIAVLRGPFLKEPVAALVARAGHGGPAEVLEIESLLAGPRLDAARRQELTRAGFSLTRDLNKATLMHDQAGGTVKEPEGAEEGPSPGAAERRARLSLDLLKLAGLPEAARLETDLLAVARQPSDAGWQALGDGLRAAWAQDLPRRAREARDPAVADRLGRLLDDEPDLADRANADLRRRRVRRGWQWLGQHFQAEADRPAVSGKESWRDFFGGAARDCRRLSP